MIPATKRCIQAGGQFKSAKNIRVAAYGRVSTAEENQQNSYITQCTYYTDYITQNPNWNFAGLYADEAVSGTSRSKRLQFNKMMKDAENGAFDYIITKSISRFARNTVDSLTCVRRLKELSPPVGVYFEKENLDTLDARGELFITILSALAQEESQNISSNIRWALQKNFQAGKPQVNLKRMLGYDKGEDGKWLINKEQAEVVQYIFKNFAEGLPCFKIAARLNTSGVWTVNGNKWRGSGVRDILRNEKYVGDLIMQKTVTVNFLSHKSVENTGQSPKYYKRDHHEAIIDRQTWEKVQAMLCGRQPVLDNLVCAECGGKFRRMSYSLKTDGENFRYYVWRCGRKGCGKCDSPLLVEVAVQQGFMEMLFRLKKEYEALGEASDIACRFKNSRTYQTSTARKNYEFFIRCLLSLPEHNPDFPDLPHFDKGMYQLFIQKAAVQGDTIEFTTNFGIKLPCPGIRRDIQSFIAVRHRAKDRTESR